MSSKGTPGPSSAPLLPQNDPQRRLDVPKERRMSFERTDTVSRTLYNTWKGHIWTFVCWFLLSVGAIILIPFSDTLDAGESFVYSIGAWLGLVASVLYFLPLRLERQHRRIKIVATAILSLSILVFVTDFPIFAAIVWSAKNSKDEDKSDDVVLAVSAGVLFLHGCFAVVAFAKCMVVGTYELPPGERVYTKP